MKTKTKSENVYGIVKDRILKGVYSPSESLKEVELSIEFDVSRNTLKKALMMLETEQLVSIEQNKGARVKSYSLNELLDLFEIRAELEGLIVRKTAPVISEESLENLEELLHKMKNYFLDGELQLYSQTNQLYHKTIYDSCPSKYIVEFTQKVKNQMRKFNTKTILIPGRAANSFEEHFKILNALKRRDAAEAEKFMMEHILNVRGVFESNASILF